MSQPNSPWNTSEAPKDGTPIVAVGRVIWSDEFSTAVDPFCGAVFWEKGEDGYEGWRHWPRTEYGHAMVVARTLDDDVRIDFWMEHPHAKPAKAGTPNGEAAPAVFDGAVGIMVREV